MSARPDSSAEFASVWVAKPWTLIAPLPAAWQLSLSPAIGVPPTLWPMNPQASFSSIVPDSTATVRPHMSAALLMVGPPEALTIHASPAL